MVDNASSCRGAHCELVTSQRKGRCDAESAASHGEYARSAGAAAVDGEFAAADCRWAGVGAGTGQLQFSGSELGDAPGLRPRNADDGAVGQGAARNVGGVNAEH